MHSAEMVEEARFTEHIVQGTILELQVSVSQGGWEAKAARPPTSGETNVPMNQTKIHDKKSGRPSYVPTDLTKNT